MNVVISGMGHCSALGTGMDSLRRAWLDGARPRLQTSQVATARGPVDVSTYRIPPFTLPKLVPEAVERRMSRFSKISLITLAEALEDAGALTPENSQRTGLVIGTAFGNLDFANSYQKRVLLEGAAGASPTLFSASIHNSLAAQLTLTFSIRGPNSTVATMEQTAIGSMRLAYDWIQQGAADRVVVVVGDELSEYHLYYLAHRDCDFPAGEGMHAFVLEREDLATKFYARVHAPEMVSEHTTTATHHELFGKMITGTAFEMALATLEAERTGKRQLCVQSCRDLPNMAIELSAPAEKGC